MNSVKLSVKMADELLSYFRKHLETENKAYSEFLGSVDNLPPPKDVSEEKKDLVDFAKELSKKYAEKQHSKKVAEYTKFIEYLTVGVEEDEEVKVVSY